jgi:SpoVK/Ycf46/Vps4 family AAA+-type ATPase
MLVFEDIDRSEWLLEAVQGDRFRGRGGQKDKVVTMAGFLNVVLDGVAEAHGQLIILTANDDSLLREEQAKAMVRPGRIDRFVEIGACDAKQLVTLFRIFYVSSNSFDPAAHVSLLPSYDPHTESPTTTAYPPGLATATVAGSSPVVAGSSPVRGVVAAAAAAIIVDSAELAIVEAKEFKESKESAVAPVGKRGRRKRALFNVQRSEKRSSKHAKHRVSDDASTNRNGISVEPESARCELSVGKTGTPQRGGAGISVEPESASCELSVSKTGTPQRGGAGDARIDERVLLRDGLDMAKVRMPEPNLSAAEWINMFSIKSALQVAEMLYKGQVDEDDRAKVQAQATEDLLKSDSRMKHAKHAHWANLRAGTNVRTQLRRIDKTVQNADKIKQKLAKKLERVDKKVSRSKLLVAKRLAELKLKRKSAGAGLNKPPVPTPVAAPRLPLRPGRYASRNPSHLKPIRLRKNT